MNAVSDVSICGFCILRTYRLNRYRNGRKPPSRQCRCKRYQCCDEMKLCEWWALRRGTNVNISTEIIYLNGSEAGFYLLWIYFWRINKNIEGDWNEMGGKCCLLLFTGRAKWKRLLILNVSNQQIEKCWYLCLTCPYIVQYVWVCVQNR